MPPHVLTIGTRGSKLALVQTDLVLSALRKLYPQREFRVKTIKTKGDVVTQTPIEELGRGAFSREIENALLNKEIDFAVHSLKDLPGDLPKGLILAALPERADPRDVLISKTGLSLGKLQAGAVVGTSSPRRTALVKELRPDLNTQSIRGNVDTRVRKLENSEYDAIVLAAAGLDRLGLHGKITEFLDPDKFIPAVSQGVLAVEARESDTEVLDFLKPLDHVDTRYVTRAERRFLQVIGGGCKVPVAAYATIHGARMALRGLVASPDGTRVYRLGVNASIEQAEEAAEQLVRRLRNMGANDLLNDRSAT